MTICLKNGVLCDAEHWYTPADILVEDGEILAVGPNLDGDKVIDMEGKTLFPGFIDAHIHVTSGPGPYNTQNLADWAQNGVLTVRDLGLGNDSPLEDYLAWRREIASPQRAEILTAGRCVAARHGYMHLMGGMENGIGVSEPKEAAAAIAFQTALGCEGVKTAMDYEMMDENTPQHSPETLQAIAEKARELGIWCTAHVQRSDFLRVLVENGIPEMAHTVIDPIPEDLLDKMIEKGVAMCSTLQPINAPRPPIPPEEMERMPPEMKDMMAKMAQIDTAQQEKDAVDNIRRFHAKGGLVAMGTDTMRMELQPGSTLIPVRELQLLNEAGLTQQEVIASATKNAAVVCKVDDRLGSLAVGKQANIIAIEGGLDEDFRKLHEICFVMNQGEIIKD